MRVLLWVFLTLAVSSEGGDKQHPENNVCKTYTDYLNKNTNENCWYNPDVNSNPGDVFRRRGYPFEEYRILTEDGYFLTLFRVPHNGTDDGKKRTPVYLQHGITSTSGVFYAIGKRSLAFFLSDQGFDVWIGNARGTNFSKGHTRYTIKDEEYWLFSFHEIGVYDLSASLNFIREKTKTLKEIVFIGHSMGTTSSYVYSIVKHEEAGQNLAGLISLAPIAFMGHLRSPQVYASPFWRVIKDVAHFMGVYGLFENLEETREDIQICMGFPTMPLCIMSLFLGSGFDFEQILPEDVPVLASYAPGGSSLRCFVHFAQEVMNNGTFQYFDHGEETNLRMYGLKEPPAYNLSKITYPVHLFYGRNDFLADEEDVLTLFERLKTPVKTLTHIPLDPKKVAFNHGDFIYAKDLERLLYPTLLDKIYSLVKNT